MTRFEQFKDKIANMTIKDLAEYINKYLDEDACKCCNRDICHNEHETCVDGIMKYLSEEVK